MNHCRDSTKSPASHGPRSGGLAAVGALFSAIASSACCWLPLLLLGFGASATGLSAWFERYRLPFLIAAGVMLAFAFYTVYFRGRRCEPGSACATATPGPRRFTKTMLWASAVFIVAFAAFPKYVGALIPDAVPAPSAVERTRTATFRIDGMTCEACAIPLRQRLREVEGVVDASVSYAGRSAIVVFEGEAPDAADRIADAAGALGYSARTEGARPKPEADQPPGG